VTTALIAILSTLVFTGVGKIREAADSATCLSNLRAWGRGFSAFAADNNNRLPEAKWGGTYGGWQRNTAPYMGYSSEAITAPGKINPTMPFCRATLRAAAGLLGIPSATSGRETSFCVTPNFSGYGKKSVTSGSLEEVMTPVLLAGDAGANAAILTDMNPIHAVVGNSGGGDGSWIEWDWGGNQCAHAKHAAYDIHGKGAVHCLFMDGHAASVAKDYLKETITVNGVTSQRDYWMFGRASWSEEW
jgi:prepilin-type processing-associated H-X9-DG protein